VVNTPESELAKYRLDSQLKSAGARITHARTTGNTDQIATAESNLAALRIEAAIQRALNKAPKALTPAQVRRLTALLRGAE